MELVMSHYLTFCHLFSFLVHKIKILRLQIELVSVDKSNLALPCAYYKDNLFRHNLSPYSVKPIVSWSLVVSTQKNYIIVIRFWSRYLIRTRSILLLVFIGFGLMSWYGILRRLTCAWICACKAHTQFDFGVVTRHYIQSATLLDFVHLRKYMHEFFSLYKHMHIIIWRRFINFRKRDLAV